MLFRSAKEFASLGSWEKKLSFSTSTSSAPVPLGPNEANLSSWRLLLDSGSLQDGEPNLAGTAHSSFVLISPERAVSLRVTNGDLLRVSTKEGWIMLPARIEDIEHDTIWVPRNSSGSRLMQTLGVVSGAPVSVVKA